MRSNTSLCKFLSPYSTTSGVKLTTLHFAEAVLKEFDLNITFPLPFYVEVTICHLICCAINLAPVYWPSMGGVWLLPFVEHKVWGMGGRWMYFLLTAGLHLIFLVSPFRTAFGSDILTKIVFFTFHLLLTTTFEKNKLHRPNLLAKLSIRTEYLKLE